LAVLRLPEVAEFVVRDGREVVVDPVEGVGPDVVEPWLSGLVAAIVLAQRGEFALHANLVDVDGRGVAVAGASGAGKTTTSLSLARRGGTLLGDDVVHLGVDGPAVTHVTTGRAMHVVVETAEALRLDVTAATRVAGPAEKLVLPQPAGRPGTLDAAVVVEKG